MGIMVFIFQLIVAAIVMTYLFVLFVLFSVGISLMIGGKIGKSKKEKNAGLILILIAVGIILATVVFIAIHYLKVFTFYKSNDMWRMLS